jgi:hypothetical protein
MRTHHGRALALTLAVALSACTPSPGSGETAVPEPTTPPASPEVTALLNAFLEARVAGEGAQQYLAVPEEEVPLLYATTSGAPYERAEFQQVRGIDWPYGFMAFQARLFAGDTVVEQLFFTPADGRLGPDGRLGLEYDSDGFGTDIAPTTEDGQPVALPYNFFDGEVTLHAAHPWVSRSYFGRALGIGGSIRLIPEGPGVRPTTDGAERSDWDELLLIADPALLATDCQAGPDPADAAALAESIRSDPDLGATAPVAVRVGGTKAWMMDVKIAAEVICVPANAGGDPLPNAVLAPLFTDELGAHFTMYWRGIRGPASGEWMRLYLFDVPEGSSMRVLAIAIVAPESSFERAVESAAPVVDSLEFHTP